jgi:hypothetical protein
MPNQYTASEAASSVHDCLSCSYGAYDYESESCPAAASASSSGGNYDNFGTVVSGGNYDNFGTVVPSVVVPVALIALVVLAIVYYVRLKSKKATLWTHLPEKYSDDVPTVI